MNQTFLKEAAVHLLLHVCGIKSIILYTEHNTETYARSDIEQLGQVTCKDV